MANNDTMFYTTIDPYWVPRQWVLGNSTNYLYIINNTARMPHKQMQRQVLHKTKTTPFK